MVVLRTTSAMGDYDQQMSHKVSFPSIDMRTGHKIAKEHARR